MNITEAAAHTGLTTKALRYYEDIGLISPVPRTSNDYRSYTPEQLQQLQFIHHAKELGFSLHECKELLELYQNKTRKSADVRSLVYEKIETIDQKLQQLQQIRASLTELASCCRGDDRPECPILERLSSS